MKALFSWLNRKSAKDHPIPLSAQPLVSFREGAERAAIVFLPGFTGEVVSSWGDFPRFLAEERSLSSWGIYGLNYASRRHIDISGIWEADPDITILAKYLRSEMQLGPFADLKSIAFLAHSMGGLVVQRAILDDADLEGRTSNLILYGTPSLGMKKAGLGALLKRQARDMTFSSRFVTKLRDDWSRRYVSKTPFALNVVAGDRDEFVGPTSTLTPFPDTTCDVVPGNHTTLVKPESADNASVQLAVRAISGKVGADNFVDSARLAVELGDFRAAKRALMPRFAELDDAALVVLAMALDGLGEGDEALRILDDVYKEGRLSSAEAAGIIAGRVKRRWLVERTGYDLRRARELYAWGLGEAERQNDHAQGYYHAINIGFLDLMSADATADITQVAKPMADRALGHCGAAPQTNWRLATEGEAALMLGDRVRAKERYRAAAALSAPRELISTRNQALRIASRLGGDKMVQEVSGWFEDNRTIE